MKREHESVEHEPAINNSGGSIDPAESHAQSRFTTPDEMQQLRDSVAVEPALPWHQDTEPFRQWLESKRSRCGPIDNLLVTLLAGLIGGLFGVVGAMFFVRHQTTALLMVTWVIAPVAEEILKQSGMIYLLEKRPYRISSGVQPIIAAVLAGLTFSAIENVIYFWRFSAMHLAEADIHRFMIARWLFCTPLHIVCSTIASIGLVRAWRLHLANSRAFQLSDAFPWFLAAMILHGLFNCVMTFVRF